MPIYVALLRGINVGGHNKIKMADLRNSLESIGLHNVKTYIQSGNVLFISNEEEEKLRLMLETKIEEDFGFSVPVVLRNASELDNIVKSYPFSEEAMEEAKKLNEGESQYVAMLGDTPSQEELTQLLSYKTEKEEIEIVGREIYLLLRHSIRHSKLASKIQKLSVTVTVRNRKTLTKLNDMASKMSD